MKKRKKRIVQFNAEGYAYDTGDDPECWGVHRALFKEKHAEDEIQGLPEHEMNPVEFISENMEPGKKYAITIIIKEKK